MFAGERAAEALWRGRRGQLVGWPIAMPLAEATTSIWRGRIGRRPGWRIGPPAGAPRTAANSEAGA